jgi:hypothetical protein
MFCVIRAATGRFDKRRARAILTAKWEGIMRIHLAIALLGLAAPAFAADYFPPKGEAWTTHTPEQEKLDPKKLQAAIDFAISAETCAFRCR